MKLLDKKVIAEQKSSERKREVEEGMKLAKSVDALRTTHAEEQQKLKKFRDETLKLIKVEIGDLEKVRESLKKEIVVLEEKKKKAQAPIDLSNEWKKTEIVKRELFDLRQELNNKETLLISKEILFHDLEKREKSLIEDEKKAKEYLEEINKTYIKSEDLRRDIEDRKSRSDIEINEAYLFLEKKEQDLVSREYEIGNQKDIIEQDKKSLILKENSFVEREIKIESITKDLFERSEYIKEKEVLTTRYNSEASKNYDMSEAFKSETQKMKEMVEKELKERYAVLVDQERAFGYKERDFILQKEKVESDRKEIEKEKLHVASQQETLKQAWNSIKRLNNK